MMKLDAPLMGTSPEGAAAAARALEEQGFDGVASFDGAHDPFLPLALAATATERVTLSTAVAIAFARNPMVIAQIANDVQTVSRGRFVLGLGSQIRPHIERRFSETWSHPDARMAEFVRAVRAIWAAWNEGERLDFRGRFYTHTLMTPVFDPGANPFGTPPIHLAGFGPSMVGVVGEVADGWLVHPLHSRAYLLEQGLPALDAGLERSGRSRADCAVVCQVLVMLGSDDESVARARESAKAQIAFYGSTPAYRVLLDHHGWGHLQPELRRLSKQGQWAEMVSLVSDDLVDTVGVSGTPESVAAELVARYDFADRVAPLLYDQGGAGAVAELVAAVHRLDA